MKEWWELLYGIPSHYRPTTRYVPGAKVTIKSGPAGVPTGSVEIGSAGIIDRLGDGEYEGGFFVTVHDKGLQKDMAYFFEREEFEVVNE